MSNYYNICKSAMNLLKSFKLEPNSAIIFDIDDTLIDRWGNCILPVVHLYHHAQLLGLIPFIVTAREFENNNVNFTFEQLKRCDIINFQDVYFRSPEMKDISQYKNMCRKQIHDLGYNVLMSVGDMPWDIGQYGGVGILLKPVC